MKKVFFTVIVLLLLAAFGISAFMVGSYVMDGKKQEQQNNDLSQMVSDARATATTEAPAEPTEPKTTVQAPTQPTELKMRPEYAEVYAQNADTVGWLRIADTKIDYPVMQTPNEANYYLYRDFHKADSQRGTIYAAEAADINKPSDNITLYGHNMKDGSMFAALNAYTNKATWENNSLIFFDTLYEYHTYKIFAVFKTSANEGEGFDYHKFTDAANEEEFNEFVNTCKSLSFYDTGITPKYGDKIICLSTCEYTLNNGRLVVAAYRIS